ncbi:quinon protein alcohol dehydrogenase-like superfamily [Roridomyces roridus]|uniref:Quinon protein alcohol dehydrogenase-like superfamily n=1 Tax=Roridomyces roridus TaxID=1738132 RepID=A0AAD7FJC1_9AGAR|nr:quinon protein alcohol dehydrogenase-like superfamily [Roridomyces roridus]
MLINLKKSFEGCLAVQSLLMSTKMLQKIKKLDQSDTLNKLNPIDMNANARTTCLSGTRSDILDTIRHWASIPGADSSSLYWLSGVAGSGKSTISTTVAETFRALERLGAFLFFDRNNQVQSHPNGVIRTLAYWLAQMNPHIAAAISSAIERDPAIVNAPIRTQFQSLLLEPLQSAESHIEGPILVLLDALDECGDPVSRASLLFVLATEVPRLPKNFRFFITSREEKDITDQLQHISTRMQLDVSSTTPDISRFITHEMELIRNREGDDLPPTWPGTQNIQSLVELSGGLFIWASTATVFIADYDPEARLQTLLSHHFIPGSNLDALYAVALRSPGPWHSDAQFAADARAVLACVVLGKVPMSDETMDAMLFPGRRSAARVLKHLRCVVHDVTRSGGERWAIDVQTQHTALALGCLQVLNCELKFNICNLEDSHLLNTEVADLADRIGRWISPQLQYSSCFWSHHVEQAPFGDVLLNKLRILLNDNFLHWLEVLSLLGQVSRASEALRAAAQYTKGHTQYLEAFIADAIKFETTFAPVIRQSAPHIYLSALAFTPHQSIIATCFADHFPHKLTYSGLLGANWPTLQKVFHGHTDRVSSICFSSDGVRIASGCLGGKILVWDTRTGERVFEISGMSRILALKFTAGDSRIVSASGAGIAIWNVITGQPLLKVPSEDINTMDVSVDLLDARTGESVAIWRAHQDSIECIHFCPASACLASASRDSTASIWDWETGVRVVGPLEHPDTVHWIQFSPDASTVVTSCRDHVYIWNANTGEKISTRDSRSYHLIFSPDGARLAGGTFEGNIEIWDTATGQDIGGQREGHTHGVTSLCFSPDGARLASAATTSIHIWDAQGDPVETVMNQTSISDGTPTCLDLSRDGTRLAYGTSEGKLIILDMATGVLLLAGPGFGRRVYVESVHFSLNGDLVAAVHALKVCIVYNAQTLAEVAILEHFDSVRTMQFSEDATQITTVTCNGKIYLWALHNTDTVPPEPIMIDLQDYDRKVISLSHGPFSCSGAFVASAHSDRKLCIWDSKTGELITEIDIDIRAGIPLDLMIIGLDFSPDATRIAVGEILGSRVGIWDIRTGDLVAQTDVHPKISALQFSPDGLYLAVGTVEGKVFVFNTETIMCRVLGVLNGHTAPVRLLRWLPNGTHVASISADKTIRFWDLLTPLVSNSALQAHLGDCPIFGTDGWVMNAVLANVLGRTLATGGSIFPAKHAGDPGAGNDEAGSETLVLPK